MVITKLLSMKGTNSLGDFEVQYLYHPAILEAVQTYENASRSSFFILLLESLSFDVPGEFADLERIWRK